MVHVAVNKYDFEQNQHFRVRFWGGVGGHQKAYAVYAFINVDNCERPLRFTRTTQKVGNICDPSGRNQSHVGRVRFPLRAKMHGRAHIITDSCFIAFITFKIC